jgi:hypothetical protein
MSFRRPALLLAVLTVPLLAAVPAHAQERRPPEALGIALEGYPYPYPVQFLSLTVEGKDVRMAYMDVKPTGMGNGRTVMLLHGKNFFGAYWKDTIRGRDAGHALRADVPGRDGAARAGEPHWPGGLPRGGALEVPG